MEFNSIIKGLSIGYIILPYFQQKIKFNLQDIDKIIEKSDFIYIVGGDYDIDAKKDLVSYIKWSNSNILTCGITSKKFYIDSEGNFFDFYITQDNIYYNKHNSISNSVTITILK